MNSIVCPKCSKQYNNAKLPFYCSCSQYISQDLLNHIKNNNKSNDNKEPSLIVKAKNFTNSVINHVSNGMAAVSASVKEERMAICRACPFFNETNPKSPTCNKCGCFLDIKTGWASEKCPEGKWLDIKTQSSGGCGCSKT